MKKMSRIVFLAVIVLLQAVVFANAGSLVTNIDELDKVYDNGSIMVFNAPAGAAEECKLPAMTQAANPGTLVFNAEVWAVDSSTGNIKGYYVVNRTTQKALMIIPVYLFYKAPLTLTVKIGSGAAKTYTTKTLDPNFYWMGVPATFTSDGIGKLEVTATVKGKPAGSWFKETCMFVVGH